MAVIKNIEMDDDGEPEFVAVRMTVEELAYIAKFTGAQSDATARGVMPGGAAANLALYECAVGELFNRYYDGGVDDWIRNVQ